MLNRNRPGSLDERQKVGKVATSSPPGRRRFNFERELFNLIHHLDVAISYSVPAANGPKSPNQWSDAAYLLVNSLTFRRQLFENQGFIQFLLLVSSLLKQLKMKQSKYLLPLAAVTVVALASFLPGSRAADGKVTGATFVDPMTACVNQYNSIVTSAKASLAGGDRNGAIRLLLAARTQLGKCEAIHNNTTASVSLGFNDSGAAALIETPPLCS